MHFEFCLDLGLGKGCKAANLERFVCWQAIFICWQAIREIYILARNFLYAGVQFLKQAITRDLYAGAQCGKAGVETTYH